MLRLQVVAQECFILGNSVLECYHSFSALPPGGALADLEVYVVACLPAGEGSWRDRPLKQVLKQCEI